MSSGPSASAPPLMKEVTHHKPDESMITLFGPSIDTDVPLIAISCSHSRVVAWHGPGHALSSDFHDRYILPSLSWNTVGSISPPGALLRCRLCWEYLEYAPLPEAAQPIRCTPLGRPAGIEEKNTRLNLPVASTVFSGAHLCPEIQAGTDPDKQ